PRWLKKEGDEVHSGDVIAEIETDKATMEYEAVDEGRIGKIIVPEGAQGIKVNQPIALLLEEGEDAATLEKFAAAAPAGNGQQAGAPATPPSGVNPKTEAARAPAVTPAATPAAAAAPGMPVFAKAQVLALAGNPPYREKPHSAMRRVIARRLTESKQTVPHFYLSADCTIDELLEVRKELNGKSETRISVNDFVIRAAALALRQVPAANASWSDDAILLWERVDIT